MRAVIQRVNTASIKIKENVVASIGRGIVVFLGIAKEDIAKDCFYLSEKIILLRLFPNDENKMHFNIHDLKLPLLVVSQFTLLADCRQGRRPDFFSAAKPEKAKKLYELFICDLKQKGVEVLSGVFKEYMQVELVNDGPVTFLLDSKKQF